MERRLLLEGDDIDELLRRVREQHGHEARIVKAEQKLVGGVGGFFAKRRFEVAVVLDDALDAASPGVGHHGSAHDGSAHDGRADDGYADDGFAHDGFAHDSHGHGQHGYPKGNDMTPDRSDQGDGAVPANHGATAHGRATAEGAVQGRPRPISSLEDLVAHAGRLDGPPRSQPPATAPAPFEATAYRRRSAPRHAAAADPFVPAPSSTSDDVDRATVFDEMMRDLTARSAHGEVPVARRALAPEPSVASPRPSRVAASGQARAIDRPETDGRAAGPPWAGTELLEAVAGPERHGLPAPTARQPVPWAPAAGGTPPTPAPVPVPVPVPAVVAPAGPASPLVSPLVALGMPAPQADPRIALLDLLTGVAVRAPQSLTGVHVVVGDPAAIRALAATWLRLCAADDSASLHVEPAGSCDGDGLGRVRDGLGTALRRDGGALVLVDAGPSRAQARRAARQVDAVRTLVGDAAEPAGGPAVTVTAVLDARWDVETTGAWLGALTDRGTRLDDLAAHGVSESAVPLRLLGHGLAVRWLDSVPATLGAWASPCLDRMAHAG